MPTKDKEIEIQVKVENVEPLISFLKKNGKFQKEKRQIDEYFTPAHRNFLAVRPVKEWLRIRDESGRYTINYKNWHIESDGKSLNCDEFETPVEDKEQIRKLFDAINMRPVVKVDKIRRVWVYGDYEISVDSVLGLGNFVEIEFIGEGGDPKEITENMTDFLKQIGVGKIQRNYQGYAFLSLFPEEAEHYEE